MKPNHQLCRAALLIAAIVCTAAFSSAAARAATFVVNSTLDFDDDFPGDGVCFNALAGGCTLRAAIEEANQLAGADRIHFNIGGPGVKTIVPTLLTILGTPEGPLVLAFPPIREEVTIDGWTQGGPNYKGPPLIEIDGVFVPPADIGILVSAGSTLLRGLVVNNFQFGTGITLSKAGDNTIQGCYVGTDSSGTIPRRNKNGIVIRSPDNTVGGVKVEHRNIISGNQTGLEIEGEFATGNSILGNFIGTNAAGVSKLENDTGIYIHGHASHNFIGSDSADGRNIISGNDAGIAIAESDDNQIRGNYIGTDVNGNGNLGNHSGGIEITLSAGNRIGTIRPGEGNTIAFNTVGVYLYEPLGFDPSGNSIRGNSIFANDGLGIDFYPDQVTPNDPLDADAGVFNLQNFPELVGAESSESETVVRGFLQSLPSTTFAIDFYSSPTCDPSGYGEGKVYLKSAGITTDEAGDGAFRVRLDEVVPPGRFITATAVNVDTLDTSEFSRCVEITEPYLVTNTEDAGPGSLRQAILDANGSPGASQIRFLILEPDPLHRIRCKSSLPAIEEPISILGSTQPRFAGSPLVILDGSIAGAGADGLQIRAGHSLVEGLGIWSFTGNGIRIEGGGENVIQGCLLGTDVKGNLDAGNSGAGVSIVTSSDNSIGGVEPGKGNVIAFNALGVRVVADRSTGNRLRGNSIFLNDGPGIDLGLPGRNLNDDGDADTGANNLQNSPVLTAVTLASGEISIEGTLNSETATEYELDFYANLPGDGNGSGRVFLGSKQVTTARNDVAFSVTFPLGAPSANLVTATATRKSEPFDTSEFSVPRGVTERGGRQVPGDCNQDGQLDISDASCLTGFLFLGSPTQLPCGDGLQNHPANIALMDWQPDGATDLSDAVGLVTFLFSGGAPHSLAVSGNEAHGCVEILGCPDNSVCPEE